MELSLILQIAMGTLLGFLSGLGVGGGSLLMLWLTLVQNVPREDAQRVNLLFFLPAALISGIFHKLRGVVSLKKLLPALAAGCLSALVFARLGESLNTTLLKKGFGVLLLFTGVREILYRPRELR